MFEVLLLLSLRRDGMIDDSGVFVYGGFRDPAKLDSRIFFSMRELSRCVDRSPSFNGGCQGCSMA